MTRIPFSKEKRKPSIDFLNEDNEYKEKETTMLPEIRHSSVNLDMMQKKHQRAQSYADLPQNWGTRNTS